MFGSPARAIVRFRYLIIAFWIAVAAFASPRASRVHDVLDVEGRSVLETESRRASEWLRQEFPQPFTHFFAVTVEGPIPIDSAPYRAAINALAAAAAAEPYVARVFSPLNSSITQFVSDDRRAAFLVAAVDMTSADSSTDLTPAFRGAVHRAAERLPNRRDYRVNVTGAPALDFDGRTVSKAASTV